MVLSCCRVLDSLCELVTQLCEALFDSFVKSKTRDVSKRCCHERVPTIRLLSSHSTRTKCWRCESASLLKYASVFGARFLIEGHLDHAAQCKLCFTRGIPKSAARKCVGPLSVT